ncbi:hypothetical protein SLEP1_g4714 [Rubroshorea leprosula]|uniref:Reverse transcriptase domain-containing protein n=1 Tax=Rubroshorea leprosula TaxID=152421 RepID=A0AAV5HYG0_9ROSI|nr:hypothetical protein SLEP1_g4714 [Rubroshorea leprosula]
MFGKFVSLDESTSKRKRFDVARILISTPVMEFISRPVTITIKGAQFKIKVTEEESTEHLFRLKSDYAFSNHEESEDSEAWSLGSNAQSEYGKEAYGIQGRSSHYVEEQDAMNVADDDVAFARWREEEKSVNQMEDEEDRKLKEKMESRVAVDVSQARNLNLDSLEVVPDSLMCLESQEAANGRDNKCQAEEEVRGSLERGEDDELTQRETDGPNEDGLAARNTQNSEKAFMGDPSGGRPDGPMAEMGPMAQNTDDNTKEDGLEPKNKRNIGKQMNTEETTGNFWKETDSDLGGTADWIDRANRQNLRSKPKRKKARKARLCLEVYKMSRICKEAMIQKKGKGKGSHACSPTEKLPDFLPGSQSLTAGASVGDSDIMKRNQSFRANQKHRGAKEIWETAKEIGLVANGNEEEITQKIEQMEIRDRKAKDRLRKQCDEEDKTGVLGFWGQNKVPVYIVNVYSPCDIEGKRLLWEEIKKAVTTSRGNWCVLGDFNAVKSQHERVGSSGNIREMREFKQFIHDSGLVDLPLVGRKFTCYHSNGNAISRLDRILLSEEWLLNWEDVTQWGLKRTISDHCPVILKNEKVDWGPKPFRLFDVWMEKPGFRELVEETWQSTEVQGWKGFCLKEKLKKLKNALKSWSHNYMEEVDQKIANAEQIIADLDKKGEGQQLSEEEIEERREGFAELWKNTRIKNRMWQQKAKRTWLREGDANTAFYHKCFQNRKRRNEINSILVNGRRCEEVAVVKEEIAKHFQNLFTEEMWSRPKLENISFEQISEAQNCFLTAPFTEEEIRAVVWDCDSSKAPGPDGLNFRFVKLFWGTIKKEIMEFIQEFHDTGRLVKGANESFVVLIPKVNDPEKIEEYRPISLIGVMYKILSKLLANRLRNVLDGVIGDTQMAFIAGRQLPESVVIANEVLDEVKNKKRKSFFFKADFEKAYDNVCWNFLDSMMNKMGFSEKWRKWIQECLKTASISVLINGSPSQQIKMSKGLRQGDPLSPFLFLLVAEGLNGLIMKAISKGLLEGIKVGKGELSISHLQFADDTLIMGEAKEENIWAVKCIMRSFELVSGLKINYAKSQLMGVNVEEEWWQSKKHHVLERAD